MIAEDRFPTFLRYNGPHSNFKKKNQNFAICMHEFPLVWTDSPVNLIIFIKATKEIELVQIVIILIMNVGS